MDAQPPTPPLDASEVVLECRGVGRSFRGLQALADYCDPAEAILDPRFDRDILLGGVTGLLGALTIVALAVAAAVVT